MLNQDYGEMRVWVLFVHCCDLRRRCRAVKTGQMQAGERARVSVECHGHAKAQNTPEAHLCDPNSHASTRPAGHTTRNALTLLFATCRHLELDADGKTTAAPFAGCIQAVPCLGKVPCLGLTFSDAAELPLSRWPTASEVRVRRSRGIHSSSRASAVTRATVCYTGSAFLRTRGANEVCVRMSTGQLGQLKRPASQALRPEPNEQSLVQGIRQ